MSLPLIWIDRIFEKLTVTYGQQFLGRWRDVDLNAVKNDWASQLSGLAAFPQGIAYALENLDDEKPPTVLMFKAIALRAPRPDAVRLDEPKADPKRVAAELAKLAPMRGAKPAVGRLDWAKALKAKDESNPKLVTETVRKMYKDALKEAA
jgi:hypothetical protein